jgi:autotransporter-associated beta strand protein
MSKRTKEVRKNLLPLLLALAGVQTAGSVSQSATTANIDLTTGYTIGGNLDEQGWGAWGTTGRTSSRVKVGANGAILASVATAQAVYKQYSPYQCPAAGRVFVRVDFNVSSAAAAGADFFLVNRELNNTAAAANINTPDGKGFFRTYIKSSGAGYLIGWNPNSQSGGTPVPPFYDSTVLNFNTTYTILIRYDAVSGSTYNDVSYIMVNPTWAADPTSLPWISGLTRSNWTGNNTVTSGVAIGEFSSSVSSGSSRIPGILGLVLKQNSGNALTVSKIALGDTLADVGILAPAPGVPTSSAATSPGTGGFTANWAAASGATGYYLDVATDSGFTSFVDGYNNKDVGAALSSAVTGTFEGGTTLYYRVRAYNPTGTSADSTPQTVAITAVSYPTVSNATASGTVTWVNGPGWSPNKPVSASNATVTFNGVLNGVLTANNDTASPFVLNSLVFANSGAGTNDITGSVLQLTNNGATNPTITFANNSTYQRVSAPIQLDTNMTVSQSGSTASNSILAGVVSGTGGLTKGGAGYVYLTQTNNSFGGPVTIGNGTLVPENIGLAGQNSSLGTNGAITLGGGGLTGTLRWGSGSVTNEATDKTFALAGSTGGGTIDVRGTNSLLTLNGVIDTGANAALRTFTLTGEGGATVNGLISGNSSLRVNGSKGRTVILANAGNSFGGPVTIDGNIAGQSYRVQVASIGNAGLNSPLGTNSTINIGTTNSAFNFLVWSNTVPETTDKTINLAGTVGAALIANKGPALLKFTAPVTATGVGVKTLYPDQDDANGVTEFAGEIPNSSGGTTALNKNGLGALILSAANTFTGGFTLKGGTLELRNAQSLATGNILIVPTNATLFPRVKVAYAGVGSDLGNLTLGADATIDLGTDNTAEIRFGSATGWTADKILTVANSISGGKMYIDSSVGLNLNQIKSLEEPTWPASLDANGLLTFTSPAPVNTAPTITSGGAFSVPENSTAVTTVTATDAEGNALTYTISGGSDADKFWIDSGTGILTFVSAPNFESPIDVGADNVYNLTVQVADGVLAATKDIAVTVTNVSDSPADYKADWLAANGLPAGSSWNSDPNNVGYSLATAYAFGLSPSVNSGAPVALASSPAGLVKIVYLQREDTSGVTYTVQSGTDLAAGLNGTVNPQVSANQPVPGKPGYTQYEASYSSGVDKGFLKVQAEVP